jgi:hypothetical protein
MSTLDGREAPATVHRIDVHTCDMFVIQRIRRAANSRKWRHQQRRNGADQLDDGQCGQGRTAQHVDEQADPHDPGRSG